MSSKKGIHLRRTTILDLNSDCLLKILRYLDVKHLAAASDSCRRFRDEACEAFKFECKNKMICLSSQLDHKIATTAILRNFGNQLQKIHINFGEKWIDYHRLMEMVIEKCNSVQLTEVHFSLELKGQYINCFKNKFTNLKILGLNTADWLHTGLNEPFSTLEEIELIGSPLENQHALQFIRLHPQLKRLSIRYTCRSRSTTASSLLPSIDQYLPQLEELELSNWSDFGYAIGYQPRFLKNLKRLSICCFESGYKMRNLSISNEKIEELELKNGMYTSDVTDFICHYKEVRKLTIHSGMSCPGILFDYRNLLKLNEHLPKLTELEIVNSNYNCNSQEIVQFVLGCKQLVSITIKDTRLNNNLEFAKYVQSKLDATMWTVDCKLPMKKLVIRNRSSNRNRKC